MFEISPNGMVVDLEVSDMFPVNSTEMEAVSGGTEGPFYDFGHYIGEKIRDILT
jgi:hypothetical protein